MRQQTQPLTDNTINVLLVMSDDWPQRRVIPRWITENTDLTRQDASNTLRHLTEHGITTKLCRGFYKLQNPEDITAGTPIAEAARAFLLDEFESEELHPEDILADELDNDPRTQTTPDIDIADVPSSVEMEINDVILHWNPGRGLEDGKKREEYGAIALKWLYHRDHPAQKADFEDELFDDHSLESQTESRAWWQKMILPLLNTAKDCDVVTDTSHGVYEWTGSE